MFGIGIADDDAIALLKADHKEVDELFYDYEAREAEGRGAGKEIIVRQICEALTIHATIEEEIFYPAVRKQVKEARPLVDEAAVEHQTLKDIIARLSAAPLNDPLRDAGVKVLSEHVKHHVKEEESGLFPEVRGSDVDLVALGKEMRRRRTELERIGRKGQAGWRRHFLTGLKESTTEPER